MKIEFIKEIPKGFSVIKGMREPIYGDDNELIGFTYASNGKVESGICIVSGKEEQVKKYHEQIWKRVSEWLEKQEERTITLMMSRKAWKRLEDFAKKNEIDLDTAFEEAVFNIG